VLAAALLAASGCGVSALALLALLVALLEPVVFAADETAAASADDAGSAGDGALVAAELAGARKAASAWRGAAAALPSSRSIRMTDGVDWLAAAATSLSSARKRGRGGVDTCRRTKIKKKKMQTLPKRAPPAAG
jgi:hypothetical protein